MLAVDRQQEERDVGQEGEELLKAVKMEEAAFAIPELKHQEKEQIKALHLQHQECSLHFKSAQEQMVLELLALQVLGNYQLCDHQE